jgi:hypothetical protein
MVTDETITIPFPIGQRFSRLTTAQQVTALREALAWQRQGMDWIAALTLAVEQVELAPDVERLRRQVQQAYATWQTEQRAKQAAYHTEEVLTL